MPVNPDAFSTFRSSHFQPHDQLNYNSVSCNFGRESLASTHPDKGFSQVGPFDARMAPSIPAFSNQHLIHGANQPLMIEPSHEITSQNPLALAAHQRVHPRSSLAGLASNRNLVPTFSQAHPNLSMHNMPLSTNIQQPSQALPWESNAVPQTFPLVNGVARTSGPNKASVYKPIDAPLRQLPLPPLASDKSNPAGNHVYSSLSTGGGGRRPHLQPRRKLAQAPVSDTQSLKYCFSSPRCCSKRPQTAISISDFKRAENHLIEKSQDVRLIKEGESSSQSITKFHIQAEDRYWRALSSLSQQQKRRQKQIA